MEEKVLWGIIDELRDDVNAHIDAITDLNSLADDLQAENKRLVKQVGSNSHNNSSTHTHTKGGDVMPTIDEVRESCGEIIE